MTKDRYEQENQGVLILVFSLQNCAELALSELKEDRSTEDFRHRDFREVSFSNWKAHSGIPSDDIIWQNVGKLKKYKTCDKMTWFLKPTLLSFLTIIGLLSLETLSLNIIPMATPGLLFMTCTLYVFYCFYYTPKLVFLSVKNE